jgi:hypothetical protein
MSEIISKLKAAMNRSEYTVHFNVSGYAPMQQFNIMM